MNSEKLPHTARQRWEWASYNVQEDVNKILDDLSVDIAAANVVLTSKIQEEPLEAFEEAKRVIEWLDERWPYSGDAFMVSGEWYAPELAPEFTSLHVSMQKSEAFHSAVSDGFTVSTFSNEDETEDMRIGLSFKLAEAHYASPMLRSVLNLYAFAEPHEVSVQYMRPKGEEIVSSSLSEVHQAIQQAGAILSLYTDNPSSSFYRQSENKQQEFMRDIIDLVDSAMPAPETMDKLMIEGAKVDALYMNGEPDYDLIQISPGESGHIEITGHVIGVNVCNIPKPQNTDSDEVSAKPELCLVVVPYAINLPSEGDYSGSHMLLPVRDVAPQSLNLV